ncbi:hypothetical protein, partial [Bilophila wadsworthia]|uniref:hypothetical protein n=1 Tax=Bilophila wadsworthia TaxID=35833 RepID=UPI002675AC82
IDRAGVEMKIGGGRGNFLKKVSPSPSKPPPSSSKTFDWWGGYTAGVRSGVGLVKFARPPIKIHCSTALNILLFRAVSFSGG